jgi:O-antigen/teichoic acid export membrane protein
MASQYKASLYNYIFNSVNTIVVIINGIILVPVYFHYISLSTYGAWLASGNVVGMLGLLESGFASVITQRMSAAIVTNDRNGFQKLAGANISSALIMGSLIFLLGLLVASHVPGWVNCESSDMDDIKIAFILSLSSTCICILVSFFGVFPQVWQDTKAVGMINVFTNFLSIASLVVYLLCGFNILSIPMSYLTRACANLLLQGSWIIIIWKKKKEESPVFETSTLILVLKSCIFPLVSKIANTIGGNSQSFILASFISPSVSAVYELTSKVAKSLCTFMTNANGSFFALFALTISKGDKAETDMMFKKVSSIFSFALFTSMIFTLCITKGFMTYWVGVEKYGGYVLLSFIIADTIYTSLNGYINNVLYCAGLINKSALLDMLKMVTYIVILLVLLPFCDSYAIPISSALSAVLFLLVYFKLLHDKIGIEVKPVEHYIKMLSISSVVIASIGYLIDLYVENTSLLIALNMLLFSCALLTMICIDKTIIVIIRNKFLKR